MILTDAGPLVALIDRDDGDHRICVQAAARLRGPMLTTWPAFTEAMYLLGARGGWRGQSILWGLVTQEELEIARVEVPAVKRARDLMEKYRDVPMDLADATLVTLAEATHLTRIFTLDSDFRIYRLSAKKAFEIVP